MDQLPPGSKLASLTKYDVTSLGHAGGGTGILDFGGKLAIDDIVEVPKDGPASMRTSVHAVSVQGGRVVMKHLEGAENGEDTVNSEVVRRLEQRLRRSEGELDRCRIGSFLNGGLAQRSWLLTQRGLLLSGGGGQGACTCW